MYNIQCRTGKDGFQLLLLEMLFYAKEAAIQCNTNNKTNS